MAKLLLSLMMVSETLMPKVKTIQTKMTMIMRKVVLVTLVMMKTKIKIVLRKMLQVVKMIRLPSLKKSV